MLPLIPLGDRVLSRTCRHYRHFRTPRHISHANCPLAHPRSELVSQVSRIPNRLEYYQESLLDTTVK